jgi:RNA polymerase sigma-70 factor (ECF subfamily)
VVAVVGSENPVQIDPGSFCRALYPRLVGALSLSCANRDDAEELAQETLSRVLEHWEHVQQLDDPEAWACRTGFNLTNSWWRRRAVARRVEERLRRRRATDAPSPDTTDDRLDLRRAVAALPRRQREVIVLRFFLDSSVAVTAARMNCAEGTVKALTHQAIDTLRHAGLTDLEGDDDE